MLSCGTQSILGKLVQRPAKLDKKLARELKQLADPTFDPYDTVIGKTMCTYDFYEGKHRISFINDSHIAIAYYVVPGQGRLDGAFCEFSENDKMDYLKKLEDFGVVNIEMESTIFAALTYHAGIRAAIVCVTLLDRLKGDQVYQHSTRNSNSIFQLFIPLILPFPGEHTEGSDERMAKTTTNIGLSHDSKAFGVGWPTEATGRPRFYPFTTTFQTSATGIGSA